MSRKTAKPERVERAKDVPVTQEMLYNVRDQLLHNSHSLEHRMEAFEHRMDAFEHRMDAFDHKLDALDQKIDSRFNELKVLIEEQNARNRIVLDGLTNLFARQERLEVKFSKLFND